MMFLSLVSGFWIGLNLIVFMVFGYDKYGSSRGWRRVRERRLLWLAWIGGSVGAIAGQKVFRHKTRKFPRILWVILAVQTGLLIGGWWLLFPLMAGE